MDYSSLILFCCFRQSKTSDLFMNGFLLGSNGCGITILCFGYASGGKLCYRTIFAETVHMYCVAMSREGLVSIVLVGF